MVELADADLDMNLDMTLKINATSSPNVHPARLVAAAVLAAAATGFAVPAQAQNYPWCLQSSAYEGGENCGFSTYDQCRASRLGIGGFCQANTQYPASGAPAPHRALKTHSGKP
jgi:uncharacterized low-complexity protein